MNPATSAPNYTLEGFRAFCRTLVLDSGKPFDLERFQSRFLADHFAGSTELVIIIPKKNGKTTLMAALGLFHLLCRPDAEAVVVASSRDQASVLYQQAVGLIQRSGLDDTYAVRHGYREIRLHGAKGPRQRDAGTDASRSRLRVLAADANTADGVIPTLALVDELHRHRSSELYATLRYGLAGRDGAMVTISTAGYGSDTPLGKLRTSAHELTDQKHRGRWTRYAGPGFVLHEWACTDADNLNDLKIVGMANPASWRSKAKLREERDSPSLTPSPQHWARFICGVWSEGAEPAIDAATWDAARVDIGQIELGETVWLAEHPGESAWIGFAAPRDGGKVAIRAEHLGQDRSGVKLERRLLELQSLYDVVEVAHRRELMRSAEESTKAGLEMTETPYSSQRLRIISQTFNRVLSAGELMHDGDPELRAQVLAATAKETQTGWGYIPNPRCSGLFAVANAVHQATAQPAPPTEYVAM